MGMHEVPVYMYEVSMYAIRMYALSNVLTMYVWLYAFVWLSVCMLMSMYGVNTIRHVCLQRQIV